MNEGQAMDAKKALTDGLDLRRSEDVAILKERLDQASEEFQRDLFELQQQLEDLPGTCRQEVLGEKRLALDRRIDIKRRQLQHFRNIWLIAKSNLELKIRRTRIELSQKPKQPR